MQFRTRLAGQPAHLTLLYKLQHNAATVFQHMVHRRAHLIRGKAKAAEVYPMRLRSAILRGLKNQLGSDGRTDIQDIGSLACEEAVIHEFVFE